MNLIVIAAGPEEFSARVVVPLPARRSGNFIDGQRRAKARPDACRRLRAAGVQAGSAPLIGGGDDPAA